LKSNDGEFEKAVIARGDFLGLKHKFAAVPYNKIERLPGTRKLVWDIPKDDFLALIGKERKSSEASKQMVAQRGQQSYQNPKAGTLSAHASQPTKAGAADDVR